MAPWRALAEMAPFQSEPDDFPLVPMSRWEQLLPDYVACVDEPACFFWKQLAEIFPTALVILSTRDTDSWWASMHALEKHRDEELKNPDLISRERREFLDFEAAIYPVNQDGLSEVWESICNALRLPVPDTPFPHANKRAEYHGY